MSSTGKKVIAVCCIALLIVVIAVVTVAFSGNADIFSGGVNYATQPVKSFLSSITDKIDHLVGHITNYDSLVKENEQLREEIAKLQEEYLQYVETNEENEKLRNLLGLADSNPSFEFADTTIIAWTASSWNSSFTINSGSNAGIELNDCVVDEYGHVLGLVTEVTANSAVVTTIIDTTSRISAKVAETGDTAIASGKFEVFNDGQLALTMMPDDHEIINGYFVTTSGIGGACPAGLLIGSVVGMELSASGLDDYAIIEPAADFDSLIEVFVIISY